MLSRLTQIGNPVSDPTAELERWLTRNLSDGFVADRQLFEPDGLRHTLRHRVRLDEQPIWPQRSDMAAFGGIAVTGVELLADAPHLFVDLFVLRNNDLQPASAEKLQGGNSFIVVEPLA